MEPVLEEEGSKRSTRDAISPRQGTDGGGKRPLPFTRKSKMDSRDLHPSVKYPDIDGVNQVTLRHALAAPKPTLPRRPGVKTWNATAKERNPLIASLTGPGRAGKHAELLGDAGGLYQGEVLAGRPHGYGTYLAAKSPGSLQRVLQYEGDWVQGRREGMGTRYYANGEQYTGQFVANIRHGTGRYTFESGDIYIGQWLDDRRTGRGTYFYANGDIFVGNFVRGKKEGLGTLYMVKRLRKYIAEYVNNAPKCGSMLALEDTELQPLQGQLVTLALSARLDMAATGQHVAPIPPLELKQPNKVLAGQVVDVRQARADSGRLTLKAAQESSGTLSHRDLEMLRHSFTLMAGGDDLQAGLLPHQLRELCVMAGLDPAAPVTRALVEQLLEHRQPHTGRIGFDDLMKVAVHFKDQDEDDLLQQHTLLLQPQQEEFSAMELGVEQCPHDEATAAEDSEFAASPQSTPNAYPTSIDPSANYVEGAAQPIRPFLQSLAPASTEQDSLIATEVDTAGGAEAVGFGSRCGSMQRPSSGRPTSARPTSARPTSAVHSRPSSRQSQEGGKQLGETSAPSATGSHRGSDVGSTRQDSLKKQGSTSAQEKRASQQGGSAGDVGDGAAEGQAGRAGSRPSSATSYQQQSRQGTPGDGVVQPAVTEPLLPEEQPQQEGAVTQGVVDGTPEEDTAPLPGSRPESGSGSGSRSGSARGSRPASAVRRISASAEASSPEAKDASKRPSLADERSASLTSNVNASAGERRSSSANVQLPALDVAEQVQQECVPEDDVLFASLAAPLHPAAQDQGEAGRSASLAGSHNSRPASAATSRPASAAASRPVSAASNRPASAVGNRPASADVKTGSRPASASMRVGSRQASECNVQATDTGVVATIVENLAEEEVVGEAAGAAELLDVTKPNIPVLHEGTLADAPVAQQADEEVLPHDEMSASAEAGAED